MQLPELALQTAYGRLGWAVVAAALACAVIGALRRGARPASRAVLAALCAAALGAMLLPGELSPAWWLGLAFQYPSALLVGCCLLRLFERWHGIRRSRVMPHALAGTLAVGGALLYLDAAGFLARGFYYAGFGAAAPPLLAALGAIACLLAIVRGHGRGPAAALLGAIALFSLLRLPTGNLWDALLDPLLWSWAVATLLLGALRRNARRASDRSADAEPAAAAAPGLQPLAAERFSSLKE